MSQNARIAGVIEPILTDLGYALVRIQVQGGEGKPAVLQIMAERADGKAMSVDDCAAISQAISPALDVADPIAGAYALEVSSPGIDRPLVKPADFERFRGHLAKLETAEPIDGRRRFQGSILGLEGAEVLIAGDKEQVWRLPLAAVAKAKLVLTEKLLQAAKAQGLS